MWSERWKRSRSITPFSPAVQLRYSPIANSARDMGNCSNDAMFFDHIGAVDTEPVPRSQATGRLLSFHCMNLPLSKERDGVIAIRDFRGELIRSSRYPA